VAKRIEAPAVFTLLMAEDVDVAIIRPDLEALVSHAVPLVKEFGDFVLSLALSSPKGEAQGPLVRPKAGIAFHLQFHGREKESGVRSQETE